MDNYILLTVTNKYALTILDKLDSLGIIDLHDNIDSFPGKNFKIEEKSNRKLVFEYARKSIIEDFSGFKIYEYELKSPLNNIPTKHASYIIRQTNGIRIQAINFEVITEMRIDKICYLSNFEEFFPVELIDESSKLEGLFNSSCHAFYKINNAIWILPDDNHMSHSLIVNLYMRLENASSVIESTLCNMSINELLKPLIFKRAIRFNQSAKCVLECLDWVKMIVVHNWLYQTNENNILLNRKSLSQSHLEFGFNKFEFIKEDKINSNIIYKDNEFIIDKKNFAYYILTIDKPHYNFPVVEASKEELKFDGVSITIPVYKSSVKGPLMQIYVLQEHFCKETGFVINNSELNGLFSGKDFGLEIVNEDVWILPVDESNIYKWSDTIKKLKGNKRPFTRLNRLSKRK